MVKIGPKEGPCGWELRPTAPEIEELHGVLNCASGRGCNLCVKCSELALEHLVREARRLGRSVVAGLERLEAEMELGEVLGL
jgi:hypothetical protein